MSLQLRKERQFCYQQHFLSNLIASHIKIIQCPSIITGLLCSLLIKLSYFWYRLQQQFLTYYNVYGCYPQLCCDLMQLSSSARYFFSYSLRTSLSFCYLSPAFSPSQIIYFFYNFSLISPKSSISHFDSLNSSLSFEYSETLRVSRNLKISLPQCKILTHYLKLSSPDNIFILEMASFGLGGETYQILGCSLFWR